MFTTPTAESPDVAPTDDSVGVEPTAEKALTTSMPRVPAAEVKFTISEPSPRVTGVLPIPKTPPSAIAFTSRPRAARATRSRS